MTNGTTGSWARKRAPGGLRRMAYAGDDRVAGNRGAGGLPVGSARLAAGGGRFSGYASLFGVADLSRDRVERGAFARSLRDKGSAGIRMLFQHDPAEPIGRWTAIREDGRGLFVEGILAPGVQKAREVLELMRAGAIDGLSIGFRTIRAAPEARSRVRRILEADLWEISVVTFPMLPGARIGEVKRAAQEVATDGMARQLRAATNMINRQTIQRKDKA